MTRGRRRELSIAWDAAASDALGAAEALRRSGHFRSCVSRAYYAASSYVAASLVLDPGVVFRDGRQGPPHETLPDLLGERMVARMAPRAVSSIRRDLRVLYAARITADYLPDHRVDEGLAVSMLRLATMVARSVRRDA